MRGFFVLQNIPALGYLQLPVILIGLIKTKAMKKLIFLMVIQLPFWYKSQTCEAFAFNKGQRLSFELKTYPLTFESDPSMITGDTKYKVKKSIAFNEQIISGKTTPKKTNNMVCKIMDVKQEGDKTVFQIEVDGMGNAVTYKNVCSRDSLINILYDGRMPYAVKGDTSGIMLFGAISYATNPKVGSRLKGTCNVTVLADNSQISAIRRGMYMPYNPIATSAADFYSTFTNFGPIKGKYYGFTISQPALVLREEKLTLMNKEYVAFVIGTETWSKMAPSFDRSFYEMEQKYLQLPDMSKNILKEASFEAGGKRLWKKASGETMDVNEQGFSLGYKEEWYVKGLGIIKSVTYDANGAIVAISELKAIE